MEGVSFEDRVREQKPKLFSSKSEYLSEIHKLKQVILNEKDYSYEERELSRNMMEKLHKSHRHLLR